MSTIKQILDTKGYAVWSIHPQESVFAAIQQMAEKEVGALVVLEGDAVVGIISERDYARKVVLKGRSSRQTEVRDIMTPDVIYVRLDQSIEECMSIVTERRIRHLPVLDNGRLVGIISIGDLVKTVIAEQQFIIEQLEHYISRLVLRPVSALPVWRSEAPFCSARQQRLTVVLSAPPGDGRTRPRLAGPTRRTPSRAGGVLPGALWHTSVCIAYTQRRLT